MRYGVSVLHVVHNTWQFLLITAFSNLHLFVAVPTELKPTSKTLSVNKSNVLV